MAELPAAAVSISIVEPFPRRNVLRSSRRFASETRVEKPLPATTVVCCPIMTIASESAAHWEKLGDPSPGSLVDARLQLHHAAQIASSVGFTFVEPVKDDSHTNLEWFDSLGALTSKPAAGGPSFHAALDVAGLRLLLISGEDRRTIRSFFDLDGQTVEAAYAWLKSVIERFAGSKLSKGIVRSPNPIPAHPVVDGQPFSFAAPEAFAELRRWFANSDRVLRKIEAETPKASPVRCWPHHFDIATLIEFQPSQGRDSGRSIGVGMTPGDEEYPEPYLYATPWPYPHDPPLPPLAGEGQWHSEGWLGAVLTGPNLVAAGGADEQSLRAADFLGSAMEACRELVGVSD